MFLVRYMFELGYAVGDRVAEANERIQEAAQAGIQGVHDVKLYTKSDDIFETFSESIDTITEFRIKLGRNELAIDKFYNLAAVFLFAMFHLAPVVSQANNMFYKVESRLPHLVRTQHFIRDLEVQAECDSGDRPASSPVTPFEFDDVSFAYATEDGDEEQVLRDISFSIETSSSPSSVS